MDKALKGIFIRSSKIPHAMQTLWPFMPAKVAISQAIYLSSTDIHVHEGLPCMARKTNCSSLCSSVHCHDHMILLPTSNSSRFIDYNMSITGQYYTCVCYLQGYIVYTYAYRNLIVLMVLGHSCISFSMTVGSVQNFVRCSGKVSASSIVAGWYS